MGAKWEATLLGVLIVLFILILGACLFIVPRVVSAGMFVSANTPVPSAQTYSPSPVPSSSPTPAPSPPQTATPSQTLNVSPNMPEETQTPTPTIPSASTISSQGQVKRVALTFDDGPVRASTVRLLDALKEREITATFFVIGVNAQANGDILERIVEDGHTLGNHGYNHKAADKLSEAQLLEEIESTNELIVQAGGVPFLFRPPAGVVTDELRRRTAACGMPIVLWSVDPLDWKNRDAQMVAEHVLSNVKDRSIVLLHDVYETSVDAAITIMDTLTEEGYVFVSVEQLYDEAMSSGLVYTGQR